MSLKKKFIIGTCILTGASIASRAIGFCYRIFLSQTIGAEGIGIYQLIFPVYSLCYAIAVGGIQTAISRLSSASIAIGNHSRAKDIFLIGTTLSVAISVILTLILYQHADWIAAEIIREPRCAILLSYIALSLPFGTMHSCVTGYYFARKQTTVPAVLQLLEQGVRVLSSYLMYCCLLSNDLAITPLLAVIGILCSEIIVALLSAMILLIHFYKGKYHIGPLREAGQHLCQIITFSLPLTANRTILNLLHSAEAVLIPVMLLRYGYARDTALALFGILSGMALPFLLFPSAVMNAASTMLLPTIAGEQALGHSRQIRRIINRSLRSAALLGMICTVFFYLFGPTIAILFFKNSEAGRYVRFLSFLCPFLYVAIAASGILTGLGKTMTLFVINLICLLVRIGFVIFLIPRIGITACLISLLTGEILDAILSMLAVRKS